MTHSHAVLDTFIIQHEADAQTVLDALNASIATHGAVTIADLYDLLGLVSDYKKTRCGWTSLEEARVVQKRSGWTIELPTPEPLI